MLRPRLSKGGDDAQAKSLRALFTWLSQRSTLVGAIALLVILIDTLALQKLWINGHRKTVFIGVPENGAAALGRREGPAGAALAGATSASTAARVAATPALQSATETPRYDDADDIPVWKPRADDAQKFLAAFAAAGDQKRAVSWTRASRLWRRGIPMVVTSLVDPSKSAKLEGNKQGETWVKWNPRNVSMDPKVALVAMTPSLVNEVKEAPAFDWLLFGEEGTVFNMDVVAEFIDNLDPKTPVLMTDHLWFTYHGKGFASVGEHGSYLAPRCVKCSQRQRRPIPKTNWVPTHACPACNWSVLKAWDHSRPELYDGPNDYNPMQLPEGQLLVHMGAGVVLSRALVSQLNVTYMERCLAERFNADSEANTAVAFSHCVFATGVAPLDPGVMAANYTFAAFAPLDYRPPDVIRDAFNFAKGDVCCDDLCQGRLSSTATMHVNADAFTNRYELREAVRSLQRTRDIFRFSGGLKDFVSDDKTGRTVSADVCM